jgi:predicted phage terminase large subunit-like protein
MCALIDKTARRWGASAILVEDKGSGTQYIQTRQGKAPAPIIPIAVPANSKEFRFDAVTPMFEAGQIFLPERALWLPDYERELQSFPLGKHDDQVDATSQYLSWARAKRNLGGMAKLSNTSSKSGRDHRVAMVEASLERYMAEKLKLKLGENVKVNS